MTLGEQLREYKKLALEMPGVKENWATFGSFDPLTGIYEGCELALYLVGKLGSKKEAFDIVVGRGDIYHVFVDHLGIPNANTVRLISSANSNRNFTEIDRILDYLTQEV